MTEHGIAALRRPWSSPLARRTLVLVGMGAGIWLAGSAGSSAAADDSPAPLAPLQVVADQAGSLLAPVAPVVAPVVEAAVADVVTPIAEPLLTPVVRAVEPVTAPVVAVLRPVVEPVVAPAVPVVEPVLRPVPVPVPIPVAVPNLVGAPVAAVATDGGPVLSVGLPTALDVSAASVPGPLAEDVGSVAVVAEQPTTPLIVVPAPVPGGDDVPVPGPALPSGAPAPTTAHAPSSPDQHAADLPPAADAVDLVALGAARDDARDAAADRALDPTFAPD